MPRGRILAFAAGFAALLMISIGLTVIVGRAFLVPANARLGFASFDRTYSPGCPGAECLATPTLKVHASVPRTMRISETRPMIMKLEMSPLIFADLFNRQPPPRVNTNAFEVTGPSKMLVSSDGSLVQWQWLITPKAKGSHALMVDLSSYVAQWGYIQEHGCPVKSRTESVGCRRRMNPFGSPMAGRPVKRALFRKVSHSESVEFGKASSPAPTSSGR